MCLMGDFGQLPPVMDLPMFDRRTSGDQLSKDGEVSFLSFSKAVVLSHVERAESSGPERENFCPMCIMVE